MDFWQTISTYFVRYGYLVVFVGVLGENAGLPVPWETTLLAAGFFASQGHFVLPVVMGVAALGAIVGDNAGYWMGRRLGRPFIERYGRYVIARHATRQLKALLGVSVLTEALHLLLKSLIHRQRPYLWAGLWSLTDYSFPSGHSMGAMAIYGLLAYLLGLHYL